MYIIHLYRYTYAFQNNKLTIDTITKRNHWSFIDTSSGNKYFNPQPGDKAVLLFDAEKVEPVEREFDGKNVQRFQYTDDELEGCCDWLDGCCDWLDGCCLFCLY